jgi:DNA-binding PadR family transcriptional regulator
MKRILQGRVPHASVYAALSALQAKGYVRPEWAIPGEGSEGGGPPRKYFELTGEGRRVFAESQSAQRAATGRRVARRQPA